MSWLRRIKAMFFETKSVRAIRAEQADMRDKVAAVKGEAAVIETHLRNTMAEARVEAKYRPSALASGFGWKPHG